MFCGQVCIGCSRYVLVFELKEVQFTRMRIEDAHVLLNEPRCLLAIRVVQYSPYPTLIDMTINRIIAQRYA